MTKKERDRLRRAVADLLRSSGCSCCCDNDGWEAAQKELAMLLAVPMYEDLSGFNFGQYETKQT